MTWIDAVMALAVAYAADRALPIDEMAKVHGSLNAFGLVLAGILGRRWAA